MENITNDIFYVGVNDHEIDLFEGQFDVPNGMAYNSYVIMDEKIAVMDTVDVHFGKEWLQNIAEVLGERKPDYLVVQHMEPDHSANIDKFLEAYPEAKVIGNVKSFQMMDNFYDVDLEDRKIVVANNGTLSLGKHELTFIFAPMVHWPEVMVTYDSADRVLFSADGFGKFGALDIEDSWACEARRYYFGIVGKYGVQVQALLKKVSALDIKMICPLHGPVLSENLEYYLNLYHIWSSYTAETEGVMIVYASVYGNTRKAAELLEEKLKEFGCPRVVLADLAREDMYECIEDAFRHSKLVLAGITYNAGLFPVMETFLEGLKARNYQSRTIGVIENGSWAPTAAKAMKAKLEGCKNLTWTDTTVTVKSGVKEETKAQIEALAKELCAE
ncbi:MAG: FprA family A-type flavoprotein [Eubacteriales bacterium]|nr:FprA family A-type flavoprotein [Eubacteriales bacterium]